MKIAFVVQRCGEEIIGGAEGLCLNLAIKLSHDFEIEIITTCALDYMTWKNYFPSGVSNVKGITVTRFKTDFERNVDDFNSLSNKVLTGSHSLDEELLWMKKQGPFSTELFNFIKNNQNTYDIFIFFTYLYATTFYGIQPVFSKSILIPLGHDEAPLKLAIYDKIFQKTKGIIFQTEEELDVITNRFDISHARTTLAGLGVDDPVLPPKNYVPKNKLDFEYVLYIGRIDESKGCSELIDYFSRYVKDTKSDLKLVLVGPKIFEFETSENVLYFGVLDEMEKSNVLKNSLIFIMPSPYESFSIATMEAWLFNKPVIVNAKSNVLKGHCVKGNSGLFYENYEEFAGCMNLLLSNHELREKLGKNGFRYVKENYGWEKVARRYSEFIKTFAGKS